MILVTLGTQDKPFTRLLQKLENLKKEGKLSEDIIVQAGYTQFVSDHVKVQAYYSQVELDNLRQQASLIITHGGVGSILDGLKVHKKVIGIARLKQYGEHTNDHQLEILESFHQEGYILACLNLDDLDQILINIDSFIPKPYPFDNSAVLKTVLDYINSH